MRYARNTSVPVAQSKAEIEKVLMKYGASKFVSGWDHDGARIGFQISNRHIRFVLPLPDKKSKEFTLTEIAQKVRSEQDAERAWEQACRQKWRALALVIKAKLEAVESGISHFEEEFLAHIVMPSGQTVSEMVLPKIEEAYKSGKLLQLMPGY